MSKCPLCSPGKVCTGCRVRKARGTVVEGAVCRAPGCDIDHPRMLRRHAFSDGYKILCANHDALAGRRPLSWVDFLRELGATVERRAAGDRRRSESERRAGDRRSAG